MTNQTTLVSVENRGKRYRHAQKKYKITESAEENWGSEKEHIYAVIYCNAAFISTHPHLLACMHLIYILK